MKKAAIKIQTMPLRDWYVHIGSRLPYLVNTKYTNVYVAISRVAPRANVMCLLTGKLGAKSSSMQHAIVDVHLKWIDIELKFFIFKALLSYSLRIKISRDAKGRIKNYFLKYLLLFYHWQTIIAPYFLNIDDLIAFLNVKLILFAVLSQFPVFSFSSFLFVFSSFILRNTTSSEPFREILWSHFDCVIIFAFWSHLELEGKCLLSKSSAELGVSWRNSTLENSFSDLVGLLSKVLSKINFLVLNIIEKMYICVQSVPKLKRN